MFVFPVYSILIFCHLPRWSPTWPGADVATFVLISLQPLGSIFKLFFACAGLCRPSLQSFFDNHLMVEKKNKTFAGMNWIWNVCRILQVSLWMNNILKYVQQFQQVFKTSKNILFFLTVSSSPLDPGRLQRCIRPAAVFRCRCARYRLHLFRRIPRT